jgi:threonine/homoserine/homoserine lactone efflux protein
LVAGINKIIGAGYLIYIGVKGVKAKNMNNRDDEVFQNTPDISNRKAILSGFLNSLLNPKAMLFYVSLFSLMIPKDLSVFYKISLLFMIFIESFLWFGFVALVFSNKRIKCKFQSISHWIDRVTGAILITFGIKLFLTKMKS